VLHPPVRSAFTFLVAVALTMAGCAGPNQAADVPTFDPEETGSLHGRVVSDEIFPVVGATITAPSGAIAVTDPEGQFELAGLPPGTLEIRVDAVGYESLSQTAEVLAGVATELTLTLVGIPGQTPYVSTLIFTGFIGCGWAIVFGAGWHAFTPCPSGPNADRFKVDVGPDWRAGVHEMTWDGAEEMLLASSMVETCSNGGAAGVDPCPALVSGKSALKIVARPGDTEYAKAHAIDGKVTWPATNYTSYLLTGYTGHLRTEINQTLNPACVLVNTVAGSPPEWGCPFGLGATLGLRSQLFHTTFYLQEPPRLEDYSAIPDQ
jgi:hypothetical protein